MRTPSVAAPATLVALCALANAVLADQDLAITPELTVVCPGEALELKLLGCPGDVGCLLVSQTPGTTEFPGVGTFGVALDPPPVIIDLPPFPADGCIVLKPELPCDFPPGAFYVQAASMSPTGGPLEISNLAKVEVSDACDCNGNGVSDPCDIEAGTSTDWDGNGVPDECDTDCDGDGVIDGLELDSDGDGIPNDCDDDVCEEPDEPCDGGCWRMLNKPLDSGGPLGDYGFRLDGLFGDHSDNLYTFSYEWPGTDVQLCYDPSTQELHLFGVAYGGLGLAPAWDPTLVSYVLLDFTWTGATCDGKKVVVDDTTGGGSGTFTWLATGEVLPLSPKADSDGEYMRFGKDLLLHGWVTFEGAPTECCQDFKSGAAPLASCP
ncbi:MAG: hypothetical protein AAF682_23770 [Planctomycetota bacterium]